MAQRTKAPAAARTPITIEHDASVRVTPIVQQIIQDECALHVMIRCTGYVLDETDPDANGYIASPFSHDVVDGFVAMLVDGSAKDEIVHVSERRSRVLTALVSKLLDRRILFKQQQKPRRARATKRAQFEDMIGARPTKRWAMGVNGPANAYGPDYVRDESGA